MAFFKREALKTNYITAYTKADETSWILNPAVSQKFESSMLFKIAQSSSTHSSMEMLYTFCATALIERFTV